MTSDQVQKEINKLSNQDQLKLLAYYGHELTVMCREAYVFQAHGVTNPQLLRDANEIHHRIYQAIQELAQGDNSGFAVSGISHWISENERNKDIQTLNVQAFINALEKCKWQMTVYHSVNKE